MEIRSRNTNAPAERDARGLALFALGASSQASYFFARNAFAC